ASMSFVLLLLLLSVPLFSLVFLFGGIELDQVLAAFLVTAVAALTLGVIGIACSTAFRRTLPATVAAYGASFILLAGSLLYGLLFPTAIDPNATAAPAPPAVSYISPLLPLVTIGTSQPVTWYGIGSGFSSGAGGGMMCSGTPGGAQSCVPLNANGVAIGKGVATPFYRNPPRAGRPIRSPRPGRRRGLGGRGPDPGAVGTGRAARRAGRARDPGRPGDRGGRLRDPPAERRPADGRGGHPARPQGTTIHGM